MCYGMCVCEYVSMYIRTFYGSSVYASTHPYMYTDAETSIHVHRGRDNVHVHRGRDNIHVHRGRDNILIFMCMTRPSVP